MSYASMGQLIDKWLTDVTFRNLLRKDPQGAIRESGVSLTEEEWEAFRAIDWKLSDEDLKARVSKGM